MSPGSVERLLLVFKWLANNYFRKVVIEEQQSVRELQEPVIIVSNHSGMSFPWDNFVGRDMLLERLEGGGRELSAMAASVLLENPLLSPFAVPAQIFINAVPATMQNFEALMHTPNHVFINPEGIPGIGKGFNHRYELQPFSSSFVRMALKYNRRVLPVSIVNGEYLNPMAYSSRTLNKLCRAVGIPFLPLGPTVVLFAVFPAAFYIGLPARLHYVVNALLDVRTLAPAKAYDEMSVEEIKATTERVREHMQRQLDAAVAIYGKTPYDLPSLWQSARRLGWRSIGLFPLMWPFMVHRAFIGPKYTVRSLLLSCAICISLCTPVLGWPMLLVILGAHRLVAKKQTAHPVQDEPKKITDKAS